MKCQKCGSKEANVKYTQIINGVKRNELMRRLCKGTWNRKRTQL